MSWLNLDPELPIDFEFEMIDDPIAQKCVSFINGSSLGNPLDDNAYEEDFFRFHDIIHVVILVFLNWSPVFRKMLNCKRKNNPKIDRIEDGGRSILLEEAICALIHDGIKHDRHPTAIVQTVKSITSHLEIGSVKIESWESIQVTCKEIYQIMKRHRHLKIKCFSGSKTLICLNEDGATIASFRANYD